MNITGSFMTDDWNWEINGSDLFEVIKGNNTGAQFMITGGTGWGAQSRKYNFTASKSWTGETSAAGNHTHTVTAKGTNSNTGGDICWQTIIKNREPSLWLSI